MTPTRETPYADGLPALKGHARFCTDKNWDEMYTLIHGRSPGGLWGCLVNLPAQRHSERLDWFHAGGLASHWIPVDDLLGHDKEYGTSYHEDCAALAEVAWRVRAKGIDKCSRNTEWRAARAAVRACRKWGERS